MTKDERNNECEKILLGQMLLDNSVIPNIYNVVKPDCFENTANRELYHAAYRLYGEGVPVDMVCLVNELPRIDAGYIASLTDNVGSAANWKYYAEQVKNSYQLRELRLITLETQDEITKGVKEGNVSAQVYIDRIHERLSALTNNTTSAQTSTFRDMILQEGERIQEYITNKKQWLGYDTGFESINNIIGGLQSAFMIIGARPSMGKTALAMQMALNLSHQAKVLFIELEMSDRQLAERFLSSQTRIPFNRIRSGLLSDMQMKRLMANMQQLSDNPNFISAQVPTRSLTDIVNLCRQQVRNNGVKIIFIDHIGLIRVRTAGGVAAWDKARMVVDTLQQLRLELDVPIVALSQLGRDDEGKKEPTLKSFRGSGAVEEDADICCFIARDRAREMSDTDIPTDFIVGKNRDGAVGCAKLIFKPEIVTFLEEQKKDFVPVEKPKEPEPPKPAEPPKPEPHQQEFEEEEDLNDEEAFEIF